MIFKSRYSARVPSEGLTFKGPSMTLQSEYESTTIDYILKRYASTGQLGDPARLALAKFGDFTSAPDFQGAQDLLLRTQDYFNGLSADVRARFNHDVASFLNFVNDPDNLEEGRKLGIFAPETTPEGSPLAATAQSPLDVTVRSDTKQSQPSE